MVGNELFPESKSSSDTGLIDFLALYFFANIYQLGRCYIEVASVIYRKGLARAGSWFIKSTFPPFDTIVTGMNEKARDQCISG